MGWVYCLGNKSFQNLVKIGMTEKEPESRASELYSTGVPTPFNIKFTILVGKNQEEILEKELHNFFSSYRTEGREFFEVDSARVLQKAKEICESKNIKIRYIENFSEELNPSWEDEPLNKFLIEGADLEKNKLSTQLKIVWRSFHEGFHKDSNIIGGNYFEEHHLKMMKFLECFNEKSLCEESLILALLVQTGLLHKTLFDPNDFKEVQDDKFDTLICYLLIPNPFALKDIAEIFEIKKDLYKKYILNNITLLEDEIDTYVDSHKFSEELFESIQNTGLNITRIFLILSNCRKTWKIDNKKISNLISKSFVSHAKNLVHINREENLHYQNIFEIFHLYIVSLKYSSYNEHILNLLRSTLYQLGEEFFSSKNLSESLKNEYLKRLIFYDFYLLINVVTFSDSVDEFYENGFISKSIQNILNSNWFLLIAKSQINYRSMSTYNQGLFDTSDVEKIEKILQFYSDTDYSCLIPKVNFHNYDDKFFLCGTPFFLQQ